MVETKIILCDNCKKKVGEHKCNLCNIDLCPDCTIPIYLGIKGEYPDGSGSFGRAKITFCDKCYRKLGESDSSNKKLLDKEFLNKLNSEIIAYIKKKLILTNLEDEKIMGEEK